LNFKVAVFGCGYVGSEIIKALVECGDDVLGLDTNQKKLDEFEQLHKINKGSGGLKLEVPSSNLPKGVFDFVIITVPTPLDEDGAPSLKFVEEASTLGVELLGPKGVIVLESTSYPGTTREVLESKLNLSSQHGRTEVQGFGFSSERIDPGNTKFGLRDVPKVISGSDQLTLEKIYSLYSRFVNVVVKAETIEDAEMSKVIENTYRAVNIALVNSLAKASESLGVNIHEAIRLAATKPFGFQKFTPGIGVGGHCIPIDPVFLNSAIERTTGNTVELIDSSISVNREMPKYTANRAVEALRDIGIQEFADATGLIFGISYKANSADTRESAAIEVVHEMQRLGFSNLQVFDDQIEISGLTLHDAAFLTKSDLEVMKFDLCLNLTPHDSWQQFSSKIDAQVLLDCWNDPGKFEGKISRLF